MELRQTHFPYCLKLLKDGRYIVLNREYKPLGQLDREWVDYDSHPSACKLKITAAKARSISFEGSEALDTIYLYNDACVPTASAAHMKAYCTRLAVLMKIKDR
jgi:hypothetical protein